MNDPTVALDKRPFLLVSDVHAEPERLEAILTGLPHDILYKCFLGDAVGYGSNPTKTLDYLRDFDVGIAGNHDTLALGKNDPHIFKTEARESIERHRGMLGPSHRAILESLAPKYRRGSILLFHGTPDSENKYMMNSDEVAQAVQDYPDCDLFFAGHMHIPRVVGIDKKTGATSILEVDRSFTHHVLDTSETRFVVNVPSVGFPRLGYKSGYCLVYPLQDKKFTLSFVYVD